MYNENERKKLKILIDEGVDFSKITKVEIIDEDEDENRKILNLAITINGEKLYLYKKKYKDGNIYSSIEFKRNYKYENNYSDIEKLYEYLESYNVNNNNITSKDKEFYKEIRIAKGLMDPKDYKMSLKEKIEKFGNKIKKKAIQIKEKIVDIYDSIGKITVDSVLKTLLILGIISVGVSILGSEPNVPFEAYFIDLMEKITMKMGILGSVVMGSVYVSMFKNHSGRADNFDKSISIFFGMCTGIYLSLLLSIGGANYIHNFNKTSFTSMVGNSQFENINKHLKENYNKKWQISENSKLIIMQLNNTDIRITGDLFNKLEGIGSEQELKQELRKLVKIEKENIKKQTIENKTITVNTEISDYKKPILNTENSNNIEISDIKTVEKASNNIEIEKSIKEIKKTISILEKQIENFEHLKSLKTDVVISNN